MNKSVIISIKPEWAKKILNGEKTVEIRKNKPSQPTPFKCYIYETGGKFNGMHRPMGVALGHEGSMNVVAEFVCDEIIEFTYKSGGFLVDEDVQSTYDVLRDSCLSHYDFRNYAKEKTVYGWHISNLKVYGTHKELKEFGLKRPPQSWGYVKAYEREVTQ